MKKDRIMTGIKGAIFDLDGTLLDSMQIWDNIAANYLISRGATPRPGLRDELRALGGHQIPVYFQSNYGIIESEERIYSAINELLEDFYFNKAPLKEGAAELLDKLLGQNVKMCVATATDRYLVEPALERCGIFEYFERIFTCGEERTSKSSPEIYLRAAKFLGTKIIDTLVFEDALYAMKSAKKAGFPVAAVYDLSAGDQQEEIRKLCDYYCNSLFDFR